jgi:hypothetical protein
MRSTKMQWLTDALVSGSVAAILSGAVVSLRSKTDDGTFAGALNGPSQWIWGRRAAEHREASLRHTLVGYTTHHFAALFWGVVYERLFGRTNDARLQRIPPARVVAEAALMAGATFVVDYGLTPKRLQPGFEKHVTNKSLFMTYAAFAAGLALVSLARQRRAQR